MLSAAGGGFAGGKSNARLYSDPSLPKPDWQSAPLSRPDFAPRDPYRSAGAPNLSLQLPRPMDPPPFRDADVHNGTGDMRSGALGDLGQRSPPLHRHSDATFHPPLPSVSQILTPGPFNAASQPPASMHPRSVPLNPLHRPPAQEVISLGIRGPPPPQQNLDGPAASFGASSIGRRPSFPVGPEVAVHGASSSLRHPEPQQPLPASYPESLRSESFAPVLGAHRRFSTESTTLPSQEARRRTSTNGSRPRGIWTGAQFLPRFIAEHHVPGEGPCYFYDDGTHCKTIIDGEVVNAQWGVTKAGKPRKRLAVACLTCREKKIKCEPDFPKCTQCEKFGRECRFQNAPRGYQTSPEARSTEYRPIDRTPSTPPRAIEPGSSQALSTHQQSPSLKRRRDPSPEEVHFVVGSSSSSTGPVFDQQEEDMEEIHLAEKRSRMDGQRSPELSWGMLKGLGSEDDALRQRRPSEMHLITLMNSPPRETTIARAPSAFKLQLDPYDCDPELTAHLMEIYFSHINSQCLSLFPSGAFLHWARTAKDKSGKDLMVLYTIMALAAHLSPRQEYKNHAEAFAELSRCALEQNRNDPSIQLCQARLLIAVSCFAGGHKAEAWEYVGSAMRTVSALGLHSEYNPSIEEKDNVSIGYAHTPAAIAEVRRRTFWAVYLADRVLSFDTCSPAILNDEDVFLRLPCRDDTFEEQKESTAPFFENSVIDPGMCKSVNERDVNYMGFLVGISSIYMEVSRHTYRTVHSSVTSYKDNYEKFYAWVEQRLANWRNSLPTFLIESPENLARNIQDGRIGIFLGIHAIHAATVMKLNRYARGACLPHQTIRRNICQAYQCAQHWLHLIHGLSKIKHALPGGTASIIPPFISFTTLTACDIVSARGRVVDWRNTLISMNEGLALAGDIGVFWDSPRMQAKAILGRVDELSRAVLNQSTDAAHQTVFAMHSPLESKDNCPADLDLVYSTPTSWYLDILYGS